MVRTDGSAVLQMPRYPQIQVSIRSPNPLALIAAVRQELRHRGVDPGEIRRFSDQAMVVTGDARRVHQICGAWVSTATQSEP